MDNDMLQTTDEINRVIGRAVAFLISSGKQVETNSILEQLRQSEKHAVDGMKTIYAAAISLLTENASNRIV